MNIKERFKRVMRGELPDRLPVDMLWPRSETLRALQEHFGVDTKEAVLEKLGVDFRWVGTPAKYPDFEARCNGKLTGDTPGAGRDYVFHDKDTFEDEWGVVHRVGDDRKYLAWAGGPLVGKETLDGWSLPVTEWPSVEDLKKQYAAQDDKVLIGSASNPFKTAWHICGYEHFMLMMAMDPSFVHALYEQLFAWETKRAVLAAEAGADIVAVVGDVAGSNGPMFSVAMWEEFIQPGFRKMIAAIKAANPETYVFFHSDGELKEMIPAFIETGIEILNPIESNCMDPAELKRLYGQKLAFHGAISVQKTIPNGTVADVKNEVYERIRTVGYNGGYMVSNENSFPYDAPLENVLALYEAVHDFNYDSLR
jgi:uroporphyrinogen decarboxylase